MFRRQIPGVAQVARRWTSDDVGFVLVYRKEAHPNQGQFLDIVDPEGKIAYKSRWTNASAVNAYLEQEV